MKAVVEIITAVILLVSAKYIVPKSVIKFKRETIRKVDKGLLPLQRFANQLTAK